MTINSPRLWILSTYCHIWSVHVIYWGPNLSDLQLNINEVKHIFCIHHTYQYLEMHLRSIYSWYHFLFVLFMFFLLSINYIYLWCVSFSFFFLFVTLAVFNCDSVIFYLLIYSSKEKLSCQMPTESKLLHLEIHKNNKKIFLIIWPTSLACSLDIFVSRY